MKNLLKIKLLVLALTISCNLSNSCAMQADYQPFNKMGENFHSTPRLKQHNANFHPLEILYNRDNQVMQEMEIPLHTQNVEKLLTDSVEKQLIIREILNNTAFSDRNMLTITQEENDKIKEFFNENVERNLLLSNEKETVKSFWSVYSTLESKFQTSFLPILAMLGHPSAQIWYSMRLESDEKEKKLHFLYLAASQGHPEALLQLSKIVSKEIGYPMLKLASLKGSHAAQLKLVSSISDISTKHLSEDQIALAKIFKESGNTLMEDYLNDYTTSSEASSEDY